MFSFIKTILMLLFISIIVFNDMFNIYIAEKLPKTYIELPNDKFNDLYDSFITGIPYYVNQHNICTSIINDTNCLQIVSSDCIVF